MLQFSLYFNNFLTYAEENVRQSVKHMKLVSDYKLNNAM
jgi:hypothetical protein